MHLWDGVALRPTEVRSSRTTAEGGAFSEDGSGRAGVGVTMAIQTADDFFTLLEKSRLLTAAELAEARQNNGEADSRAVARSLVRQQRLTRWQAGQLLAGRSSFFLGKYKLIDLLGHGGMGRVFLGEHTTMNRRVALKILPRRIGKDPAALERFLAEARNVAALDHPNIVQAYSVDNEGDRYYLVMEYVDGMDLEELVNEEGPPEFDVAADYIRQAAEGLAHGHERGMVHCDIKPSNLLVNRQGVVKLVDMGLARAAGRDEEENGAADERVLGTVDYMAPEQGLESTDFDHRADVYSLGCTFYFLLTGRPPFPGGTLPQRILKHQTQTPPSIAKLRPGAPPELVAICERMMAKSPDDRYQSAQALSQALAPWRLAPGKASRDSGTMRVKMAEPLEAPDAGFPGINVGGTPAKPQAEKGAAAPAESGEKVGLLATPGRKIAAGVVAFLLLAGIVAGATLPFILGGEEPDEKQAAQGGTQAGEETPDGSRSEEPEDFVEDPLLDEPTEPDASQPAEGPPAGEEPPGGESDPAEPDAGEEPAAPPEENPSDQPPGEEPPGVEVPAQGPEEPDPAAEPSPGEGGGEQPDDKPEPKSPDGPKEPKPGPDTEKPKPPPKKPDPFGELASAVELPAPGGSAGSEAVGPVSLGRLQLPGNASVDIELVGGEEVLKGDRGFRLNGSGNGRWTIHFNDAARPGAEPQQTELAQINLDAQSRALQFRWLAGSGSVAPAHVRALRNCGLQLKVGGETRLLPLGNPEHVEPLQVNLQAGTARQNLPAGSLPDEELLRVEVTRLEGDFVKHKFEPESGIGGEEGVRIVFPNDGTVPTYGFLVKLAARGSTARLEATAFMRLQQQQQAGAQPGAAPAPAAAPARAPARPRPAQANNEVPLNLRMLEQALQAQVRGKMVIEAKYGTADQIKKNKRIPEQMKQPLQAQLDQANVAIGQLQILGDRCQKMQANGKIHYRVFAQIGGQQLDLVDTKQPGPAVEPVAPLGGEDGLDLDLDGDGNDSGGEGKKTFF